MNIKDLIDKNDGFLRIELLPKYDLEKPQVYEFLSQHPEIRRCGHGLFFDFSSSHSYDPEYALSYHKEAAIFSHESALYLLGMADQRAFTMSVTLPAGYNTRYLAGRVDVRVHTVSKKIHSDGIIDVKTQYGHSVKCYCRERTVCDVIREVKLGKYYKGVYNSFMHEYFANANDKNIEVLYEYAEKLNVMKELQMITAFI